jgi:DNA-binding NarL/FixJ family response regulator
MAQITLVVVDDHPLFRQGVINFLSLDPGLSVIGSAADGEEALKTIRELKPFIAIVDVNLPKLNGQQVVHQIVAEKLPTRVIMLTAYDDPEQLTHAFYSGAYAYCSKGVDPDKLLKVIYHVAEGKYVVGDHTFNRTRLDQWIAEQALSSTRPFGNQGEPYGPLSEREMEVLTYITQGMSNKDIGILLAISHQTVKNHVTSILKKLHVEDRTQAALYALRQGWVRLYKENLTNEE